MALLAGGSHERGFSHDVRLANEVAGPQEGEEDVVQDRIAPR